MPDTSELRTEPPDHRLLIYGDEAELIERLAAFVVETLAEGGAVVLVTSAGHLDAVEERVRRDGGGIEEAVAEHRYRALPLEHVVARLTDEPDPVAAFEALIESALASIPDRARPVRIHGAVVAALWDEGQVAAALEMEGFGNRLAGRAGISVVCAYPQDVVLATGSSADEIGSRHTAVVTNLTDRGRVVSGVSRCAKAFPASAPACRAARRFVRAALASAGAAALADAAELICSELAANAVRHADSPFTVEVMASPAAVRLAVADEAVLDGSGAALPADPQHGLGIVAALASNWGVEAAAAGKVVWAEMAS